MTGQNCRKLGRVRPIDIGDLLSYITVSEWDNTISNGLTVVNFYWQTILVACLFIGAGTLVPVEAHGDSPSMAGLEGFGAEQPASVTNSAMVTRGDPDESLPFDLACTSENPFCKSLPVPRVEISSLDVHKAALATAVIWIDQGSSTLPLSAHGTGATGHSCGVFRPPRRDPFNQHQDAR